MKLGEPGLIKILEALEEVVSSDLSAILDAKDEHHLTVRAALGELATDQLQNLQVDLDHRPRLLQALQGEEPFLAEPGGEPDTYEEVIGLPGEHSCLVIPLRAEKKLLGAMTLDSVRCNAFSQDQIRAVKGFAQLAARVMHEGKERHRLARQNETLALENASLREDGREPVLVGRSASWKRVVEAVRLVAPTPTNVLISGETGTGKEHVARAIHQWSTRAAGPFVAVNCAVLVPELALSVLFGHERGAFTGAERRRPGRFELAEGGTLFLDEVGELPLVAQAQLLRVLQEKTFERVGGIEPISVDVRILAATNRDLHQEARLGHFREDLYYRLNRFPIVLPPLRRRDGDIAILASHLLQKIRQPLNMPNLTIAAEALRKLERYSWPGNVRELGNVLERAAIFAQGQQIQPEHIDWEYPNSEPTTVPSVTPEEWVAHNQEVSHDLVIPEGYQLPNHLSRLHRVIAEEILRTLTTCGGKISGEHGAAKQLGVPPTTLRSMIERFQLRP